MNNDKSIVTNELNNEIKQIKSKNEATFYLQMIKSPAESTVGKRVFCN